MNENFLYLIQYNSNLENINLIIIDHIKIFCEEYEYNNSYIQQFGELYDNYIIKRKYLTNDESILNIILKNLSRLVHPCLQIFYGICFENNLSKELNFILEYSDGLSLDNINILYNYFDNEEVYFIKLLIVRKIGQTLLFLHKSEYSHLMINVRNIKFNHNLIIANKDNILNINDEYFQSNLIKIEEIGSNLIYHSTNIDNFETNDIRYMSSSLLEYIINKKIITNLYSCDIWSFGILLYELFSHSKAFIEISNKNILIQTIISKNLFDININEDINNLIKCCLNDDNTNLENIYDKISLLYNEQIKSKVILKKYEFIDINKYYQRIDLHKLKTEIPNIFNKLKIIKENILLKNKEYISRVLNIEKKYIKDTISHSSMPYSLYYLIFRNSNNLCVYDIISNNIILLENNNQHYYSIINTEYSCSIFSINSAKLIISGGKQNNNITDRLDIFYIEKNFYENEFITIKLSNNIIMYHNISEILIKRYKHSMIDINNLIFIIGGEQDKSCEVYDINSKNNYLISELNTFHINPILFKKDEKIYSLNIHNIINNYFNYNKEIRNLIVKTQSSIHKQNGYLNTKYIFCESLDIDFTMNSDWKTVDLYFNIPSDFSFKSIIDHNYIIIANYVYIIGKNCNHGICLNMDRFEITTVSFNTIKNLKNFHLNYNFIEYNNCFFYLNNDRVEKYSFDKLFN